MARQKPSAEPVLNSWQQVDDAFRRIGEITAALQEADAELNRRIQQLKDEAEKANRSLVQKKARLEKDVEEFTTFRRDEFKDRKSKVLTFGIVSFRIVKKLLVKNNAATVTLIKNILGINAMKYLHVQEKPNKEALAELSDRELRDVGIIRKVSDDFGYKLNWQNLEETLKQKATVPERK